MIATPGHSRKGLFWLCLLALAAFRLWLAAALPMTGDEAYFVFWGEHPAGGYYDHPPMVGWWLSGLLALSRAEWVLRLPAIILPFVLAWGGWWLTRPWGGERARAAALLVLLQPASVWNVLITTDTPAVLFSMLSILAYVASLRCEELSARALFWSAVAGLLLGLAFLGKYFAALLGVAYLFHVVFVRRDAGRWGCFAVLLLAALPAPLYNLWWNGRHCWVNILFNFMNRHSANNASWANPFLYAASLFYLATPWVIFGLWKQRHSLADEIRRRDDAGAVYWMMLVPLSVFALMALARPVGLHWLLSFVPLAAVLAAIAMPQPLVGRLLNLSAFLALLHVFVFVTLAVLPLQTWSKSRFYEGVVLTARADDLLAHLEHYAKDYLFSMESYSSAATLAFNAHRPFAVFGEGSFHARQDDFITDWRMQDGRNVLILRKSAPVPDEYAPFFGGVDVKEFEVSGARFWIVLGQGFNYSAYHDRVLTRVRERFYRIPSWLPQYGCDFCARYFSGEQ